LPIGMLVVEVVELAVIDRVELPLVAPALRAPEVASRMVELAFAVHVDCALADVLDVINDVEEHSLRGGRGGEASLVEPSIFEVDSREKVLEVDY